MSRNCPHCDSQVRISFLEAGVYCSSCGSALRPTRWSMALVLALSLIAAKVVAELIVRPQAGSAAAIATEAATVLVVMPLAYWALARFEEAPKPVELDLRRDP